MMNRESIRMRRFLLGSVAIALLAIGGCSPADPDAPTATGTAPGTGRVVALGNSLSAGFTNEGLFLQGQRAGYANLVARQITGRDMSMPLIAPPGIASSTNPDGSPRGALFVNAQGQLGFGTIPGGLAGVPALLLAATQPTPYDNLGVPGAYAADLLAATSSANSIRPGNAYYDFILRNFDPGTGTGLPPGGTTQMTQLEALAQSGGPLPSVLLFWIGGNDVLLGAAAGNPVVGQNVTSVASYAASVDAVAARIEALGIPEICTLTVPDITAIPFFFQVAAALQAGGASVSAINTDEDDVALILLGAQSLLFTPQGTIDPEYLPGGSASLPSTLTLTNAEVVAVSSAVAGYNAHIRNVAATRGWALADAAAEFTTLSSSPLDPLNRLFPLLPGLGPNGSLGQNPGSVFGLDGVHPSQRGYAFLANLVLEALNERYARDYPLVDLATVQNTLGFEQFTGTTARTVTMAPGMPNVFDHRDRPLGVTN